MRDLAGRAFGSGGAQLPLALLSIACAAGLLVAEAIDGNAVGGPIGFVIAALFLLNALARTALWRYMIKRGSHHER